MYWTIEDLNAGLCRVEDLGNPKPAPAAVAAPVAPIDLTDKSLRERLRVDALQAYHDLGGVEYLKKNPELLDKILAKTITPEPVLAQTNVAVMGEWPEWLTHRRLAYQESAQTAEDVRIKRPGRIAAPAAPANVDAALPEPCRNVDPAEDDRG